MEGVTKMRKPMSYLFLCPQQEHPRNSMTTPLMSCLMFRNHLKCNGLEFHEMTNRFLNLETPTEYNKIKCVYSILSHTVNNKYR